MIIQDSKSNYYTHEAELLKFCIKYDKKELTWSAICNVKTFCFIHVKDNERNFNFIDISHTPFSQLFVEMLHVAKGN